TMPATAVVALHHGARRWSPPGPRGLPRWGEPGQGAVDALGISPDRGVARVLAQRVGQQGEEDDGLFVARRARYGRVAALSELKPHGTPIWCTCETIRNSSHCQYQSFSAAESRSFEIWRNNSWRPPKQAA